MSDETTQALSDLPAPAFDAFDDALSQARQKSAQQREQLAQVTAENLRLRGDWDQLRAKLRQHGGRAVTLERAAILAYPAGPDAAPYLSRFGEMIVAAQSFAAIVPVASPAVNGWRDIADTAAGDVVAELHLTNGGRPLLAVLTRAEFAAAVACLCGTSQNLSRSMPAASKEK